MALHESSVNFRNLIRDLADMYPYDISEVVVVELIANSLDAKATTISISYNPQEKILIIEDNGPGMNSAQFDEYHDFAAGLKVRGSGIGFAGLGAKVSFNIADRVITETKNKSSSFGSNWYLHSNRKLIWEEINPNNLNDNGTRVEVHFKKDTVSSFESTDDLINILLKHYLPLLDLKFLDLYETMNLYSKNIRFFVNGNIVEPRLIKDKFSLKKIQEFYPTRRTKIFGYGILGVSAYEYPVVPDLCGVLLCTHGKVIKADFFNQFPGKLGPQIFGMVEIPELVNFLTTSKTDFMRKGKLKQFEQLYNPIRQEFKEWLGNIGIETSEITGTNEALELEKELKKISEEVPEISKFFGFWTKKSVLIENGKGTTPFMSQEGAEYTIPIGKGKREGGTGFLDEGDKPGQISIEDNKGEDKATPISRKSRRGPKIAFVKSPDRTELAWVEGNNVIVNSGHPSYFKIQSNAKAKRLHNLFAIASAIQRYLGAENEKPDFMFVDRLMATWGKK
jgi:hypothetical protein